MEKFSAYRDAGTGIQPFLTPIPPQSTTLLDNVLLPLAVAVGLIRILVVFSALLLYVVLVLGICTLFYPIPPIRRTLSYVFTAILTRLVLAAIGIWWIHPEIVSKRRGRASMGQNERWKPRAGDIIVSNWTSWIELLYLAFRFDPIFVLPIATPASNQPKPSSSSVSPGRNTGTGSASIAQSLPQEARVPIIGFHEVSLLSVVHSTGTIPTSSTSKPKSLAEIRKRADRPVVVFPECTTSNGRALLRFADIFGEIGKSVPVKSFNIFVVCVRYDPPTPTAPSLTLSIPSSPSSTNPLPHLLKICASLSFSRSLTVRFLSPSESPSSPTFVVSDYVTGPIKDELSEICAALVAQLGKFKRTQMAWEDKEAFLQFYRAKR